MYNVVFPWPDKQASTQLKKDNYLEKQMTKRKTWKKINIYREI